VAIAKGLSKDLAVMKNSVSQLMMHWGLRYCFTIPLGV
jgi:hypothetical protein